MAAYNLRQLRYFVTTAECGSVAEASRKLYIAQPSVSTAIKQLEDSFGVQLFIRHHAQGVSLTPGFVYWFLPILLGSIGGFITDPPFVPPFLVLVSFWLLFGC